MTATPLVFCNETIENILDTEKLEKQVEEDVVEF